MAYTPINWRNNPPSEATPITAENLNRMDAGIANSVQYDEVGNVVGSAVTDQVSAGAIVGTNSPGALVEYEDATTGGVVADYDSLNRPGPYETEIATGLPSLRSQRIFQNVVGLEDYDVPDPDVSATGLDLNNNRDFTEVNTRNGGPTKVGVRGIRLEVPELQRFRAKNSLPTRTSYALDGQGRVQRVTPDSLNFLVSGESHMQDASGGKTVAQRWPTILQGLIAGSNVVTRAVGGSVNEEAGLLYGIPSLFTISGGSIPASGNVTIVPVQVMRTTNGPNLSAAGRLIDPATQAVLALGTLTVTGTGQTFVFNRTTAGTVTSATTAFFVSDDRDTYAGYTLIHGSGINDSVAGLNSDLDMRVNIARAVTATISIVESQRTATKACLLLGSLTRVSDYRNTAQYNMVLGVHRELELIYPDYFAGEEMRQYVNQQMIYDMGIAPTAADLTAMRNDTIPPSVTLDNQHISAAASPYVAAKVKSLLIAKGFIA